MLMCAFFAALTFLGIQMFRIPLPAAVGTPFVHFGHIFVVMGVLLQDGKRGAISGTLGFIIFDLLNGFIVDIPQVFIETIIKCLIIGWIMQRFKKRARQDKTVYKKVFVCAIVYGVMNVVIELVAGTIKLLLFGSGVSAAVLGSLTSLPATVINSVFMIVVVGIIYQPVEKILRKYSL